VERALADLAAGHGANEISLLVSASESHSRRNLNRSRDEQWRNVEQMAAAADNRFRVIGTVSVAFGCPFEGEVPQDRVLEDAKRFVSLGVRHVALGDTTGLATPARIRNLLDTLQGIPGLVPIAHFHDTRGTGLVNCLAAHEAGVRHFDSSFGGVGGHPDKVKYGEGHTGNVCTEDLASLFESLGIATGIALDKLLDTARFCEQVLGRELHGRVTRSGLHPLLP